MFGHFDSSNMRRRVYGRIFFRYILFSFISINGLLTPLSFSFIEWFNQTQKHISSLNSYLLNKTQIVHLIHHSSFSKELTSHSKHFIFYFQSYHSGNGYVVFHSNCNKWFLGRPPLKMRHYSIYFWWSKYQNYHMFTSAHETFV